MKRIIFIVVTVLLGCLGGGSDTKNVAGVKTEAAQFHVFRFDLDQMRELITFNGWTIANTPPDTSWTYNCTAPAIKGIDSTAVHCFYQDDQYRVIGVMLDENDGALLFIPQGSEDVYYFPCRHPLMINDHNGKYYVTETGVTDGNISSTISSITDPKALAKTSLREWHTDYSTEEWQGDAVKQAAKTMSRLVLDTIGIAVSVYYPFRDREYVLYSASLDQNSSMDATFVGELVDGKVMLRDTVATMGTATSKGIPVRIINDIYVYDYFYRKMDGERLVLRSEGSIYIKADTIVMGYRYFDANRQQK